MGMVNGINWKQQEVVRLLRGAPGTHYQEATDQERMIMRDWVRSLLQQQPITISFVKADGALREMMCTLNYDLIPKTKLPGSGNQASVDGIVRESKLRKLADEHTMRVFDLDKQEWRSFRFERLKKIAVELQFDK